MDDISYTLDKGILFALLTISMVSNMMCLSYRPYTFVGTGRIKIFIVIFILCFSLLLIICVFYLIIFPVGILESLRVLSWNKIYTINNLRWHWNWCANFVIKLVPSLLDVNIHPHSEFSVGFNFSVPLLCCTSVLFPCGSIIFLYPLHCRQ